MSTEPISVRVSSEKLKQLDEIGGVLDRSRNYLVNQALDDFLNQQSHIIKEIKLGIEEADRGELIPHEEVFKKLEAKMGRLKH